MELIIDTSRGDGIFLEIKNGSKLLAKKSFKARFSQAEKLLPKIDQLIKKINKTPQDIKSIKVCDDGGGFTSLRIGVVTANALAYSLGIPVVNFDNKNIKIEGMSLVRPRYSSEPNISVGKKILLH